MVVVNETKRGQLLALPPWNGPAQRKAQEVQDRIKKWSEQYPNVICYCFDSFSTLLYVL